MRNDKRRAAEYLLDELGLIDDRLIAEAGRYRREKRKMNVRYLAAAACLVVIIALIQIPSLFKVKNQPDFSKDHVSEFEEVLRGAADSSGAVILKMREVDLFDGSAKLIWRYEGEDEYSVVTISASECDNLQRVLGSGSPIGCGKVEEKLLFWISNGSGGVITPHLIPSVGNIGFGELFDYSPELEPAPQFTQNVFEIVNS